MGFFPEIMKLLLVLLNLASNPALPPAPVCASPIQLTKLIIKPDVASLGQAMLKVKIIVLFVCLFFTKPNPRLTHSQRRWLQRLGVSCQGPAAQILTAV